MFKTEVETLIRIASKLEEKKLYDQSDELTKIAGILATAEVMDVPSSNPNLLWDSEVGNWVQKSGYEKDSSGKWVKKMLAPVTPAASSTTPTTRTTPAASTPAAPDTQKIIDTNANNLLYAAMYRATGGKQNVYNKEKLKTVADTVIKFINGLEPESQKVRDKAIERFKAYIGI